MKGLQRTAHVIGDPIGHSKSPLIQNYWIEKLGLNAFYCAQHIVPEALENYLEAMRERDDWAGCNVTIPHKIQVLDLVDDPGDIRSNIGAMNTLLRREDGSLMGTNTDAAGFIAPIIDRDWAGTHAAVVGSGGAACAVLYALKQAGFVRVDILARNPLKAMALLSRFGLRGTVADLAAPLPPVDLLVNASSLGMVGQPELSLDMARLGQDTIVYDLVYAPLETGLLRAADERGLTVLNGLDMLVGQAAIAFELFFGVAPPRDADSDAALFALLES
jgi:shikimate dehydrogenase